MISGKQIKFLLKEKKIKLEQAAKELGITRQTLHSRLEKEEIDYFFAKSIIDKYQLKILSDTNTQVKFQAEQQPIYRDSKDDLIASLKETINSKNEIIEMQRIRIAELEAQVNGIAVRNSA